jgi:hypothetical protein
MSIGMDSAWFASLEDAVREARHGRARTPRLIMCLEPCRLGRKRRSMNDQTRLRLYFGAVLVGEIRDAFCDQGTWFGEFRPALTGEAGGTGRRLRDFIAFCMDGNARVSDDRPHDVSEYDAFGDLIGPGLWQTRTSEGVIMAIQDAPNFYAPGELSWLALSPVE